MNLREAETLFAQTEGVLLTLRKDQARLSDEVASLSAKEERLTKCIEVFRVVSNDRREALKSRMERMLSYALQLVYDKPLNVEVEYRRWGNSDRATLYIRDQYIRTYLESFRGGALVEIVSFLVRLLVMCLYKPSQRRLFMADEAFGAVGRTHLPALSSLLKELSKKLDLQIILVTQQEELAVSADKAYRFERQNGKTKCFPLVIESHPEE